MKKIISLFQRNYDTDRLVRDEVTPGAEWVISGEGIATRKWDGTCCRIRDGKLFKRYDVKKNNPPPLNFEPAQDPDVITGHWPGWVPVGDGSEDKWHREAFDRLIEKRDGTYELIGPKVQGNPEKQNEHRLEPHGVAILPDAPRGFKELREWFSGKDIEGVVWHHPDGRMVKIKQRDFGIKRGA